jgi:hypothetical protein
MIAKASEEIDSRGERVYEAGIYRITGELIRRRAECCGPRSNPHRARTRSAARNFDFSHLQEVACVTKVQ